MITVAAARALKEIAPHIVQTSVGGTILCYVENETMVWVADSPQFTAPEFQVGLRISSREGILQAIEQRQTVTTNIPRTNGIRLQVTAIPVQDGEKVVGALAIAMPRPHPVTRAFPFFAPMLVDMFAEGAFMFVTNLQTVIFKQGSKKFDLPIQVGDGFQNITSITEAMRSKKTAYQEYDASTQGIPLVYITHPLFDDDTSEIIACFTMVLPRANEVKVREAAGSLNRGLTEVAAAIEEMAAATSNITNNEQRLNKNVKEVLRLSDQIEQVLAFIRQIADETKMLGLNAAIEAARAGEAGRGFGVVADEIRKLSDESKETVVRIRSLTNEIKVQVKETVQGSEQNLSASEEQAAAAQEITASLENMTQQAEELDRIAKDL
ncbi:MAG: methyl-accepting chemotaxis protein [Methylocystaceae bacterium]